MRAPNGWRPSHPARVVRKWGQCLYRIGQLQALRGKCQDCKNFVASCFVWNARNLILECFGAKQRLLASLHSGENSENRFCFNPDSGLGLVVVGTLQAAIVEVEAHRQILLLTSAPLAQTPRRREWPTPRSRLGSISLSLGRIRRLIVGSICTRVVPEGNGYAARTSKADRVVVVGSAEIVGEAVCSLFALAVD